MPDRKPISALRQLRALFASGSTVGLTDSQLLQRFADRRAEVAEADAQMAFAALVDRHGPMVWGVCRRTLVDVHEAEDAFQATFLVLARRAGAVRVDGSLGRWLYGVARRVAARARNDSLRRRTSDVSVAGAGELLSTAGAESAELATVVGEELDRLPDKLRSPLVLCHMEGLTYAGAAERLGWPAATVKGRLVKGRALLRSRLSRRGLGDPDAALGAFAAWGAKAAMPAVLAEKVARAASALAHRAAAGGVSTLSLKLANGVIRTMLLIRLAKVVALIALASSGTWLLAGQAAPPEKPAVPAAPQKPAPRPPAAQAASTAIAVPLPEAESLRRLLRRAAWEAITLSKKQTQSESWTTLATIAATQASAGDPAAARETFSEAAREAGFDSGGDNAWNLWLIGHKQVKSGFRDDARRTLRRAIRKLPGVTGDFAKDSLSLRTLAAIVGDTADAGVPGEARQVADRLEAFDREYFEKTRIGIPKETITPNVAGAMAAVGDFDAAFRQADTARHVAKGFGKVALEAAKHLDREAARRFVSEASARMDRIDLAEERYFGLGDLGEAQARIGDVTAAKNSARAIGVGPSRVDYDMTDGQPYAMLRVANVQRESGDQAGARETLREAYRMVVDQPKMRYRKERIQQVIGGQLAAGDVAGAMLAVESLPRDQRYQAMALVARALAMKGDHAGAGAAAARALEDAPDIPGVRDNPSFSAEVQLADFQATLSVEVQLADFQATLGDVIGAVKTVGTIGDELHRSSALQRVVKARALAGDVAGSLRLALEESKSSSERLSALQGVGQGVADRIHLESYSRPAK